ncbi:TlpA family protein disulfide reductase [Phototrophicus methaneseepsis]|uniref:TlpA family protein disulfide reductase n=1 Tax=Phototrophicus methaneseepsis TaxID=2710758 RepID=A0A7S8E9B1_9CHLR|nr:TlpA disulfide reductase family protein [Phototrophicus methaneseepsis]QPC82643.1 TlpA family protein disulfide reductase [Phototrophicus methaneseepsis]
MTLQTTEKKNLSDNGTDNGKPAPALIIFAVIPLVGILIALLMIATQDQSQGITADVLSSERSGNTLVNQQAPYFELFDMDGNPITLDDYAGKTLFLNFWQTTCPPCVRELPAFTHFVEDTVGQDVAVLAVNFDETSEQVREFLAQYDIVGLPVGMDPTSDVRRTYGVHDIPTTFVIDGEGKVRFWKLGEMDIFEMEEYAQLVEEGVTVPG